MLSSCYQRPARRRSSRATFLNATKYGEKSLRRLLAWQVKAMIAGLGSLENRLPSPVLLNERRAAIGASKKSTIGLDRPSTCLDK